eukprot:TRINITY_DN47320_c0_g1_i1.p1 TRINITY_DN47320_c0_g1~~TRINITY_DN47320_c0_g1_i1.p1  ORF type:complete len:272 (+),score=64.16 TRINITY_DN47320_c0_g1_i1:43-858(+)
MNALKRIIAKLCGKLPGTSGLVAYVLCCVLPCRYLCGSCGAGARSSRDDEEEEAEAFLPSQGERQVLLLGLEGSGKSSFLWMCEHPRIPALPSSSASPPDAPGPPLAPPPSASTAGVLRLTRKAVSAFNRTCSVDLDLAEVGGGKHVRPYWSHYITRQVDAIAFFVDASAPDRFDEAAAELARVVESAAAKLGRTPRLLLVASKADAQGAGRPDEVCLEVRSRAAASCEGVAAAVVRTSSLALVSGDGTSGSGRESTERLLSQIANVALGR